MENEKSLEKWLPDPDTGLRADFNYARFTGGLNLIEAAVFSAHWRRGIARDRLASATGLTPRQVAITLARIEAALKSSGHRYTSIHQAATSTSPAFRELLPSGRRVWTVGRLDSEFASIMQSERRTLFAAFPTASERYPPVFGSIRAIGRGQHVNLETLNRKHTEEQGKLGRIGEKTHLARVALEDAEREVSRLQASIEVEQAESILAEREWPSLDSKKKLAVVQTALAAAQAAYVASKTALNKQAEIVTQVQGEVDARRREAFEAAIKPFGKQLHEAMVPLMAAAVEANQIAAEFGMTSGDLSGALFPQPVPGWEHQMDSLAERNSRAMLVNAALQLDRVLNGSSVRAARAV